MDKIIKGVILFLSVVLFNACGGIPKEKAQLSYDIQIDYLSTPFMDNRGMPNDTLVILFDGNYSEDTIEISINNRHHKTVTLTTDERSGLAGDVKTIPYNKVNNIGFRINKGKLIFIEPEKEHFNIRLTYLDHKAVIRFYKRFPGFM
nr:hypothetical protein [uncultured Draconibacterium sp.]